MHWSRVITLGIVISYLLDPLYSAVTKIPLFLIVIFKKQIYVVLETFQKPKKTQKNLLIQNHVFLDIISFNLWLCFRIEFAFDFEHIYAEISYSWDVFSPKTDELDYHLCLSFTPLLFFFNTADLNIKYNFTLILNTNSMLILQRSCNITFNQSLTIIL